MSPSLFTLPLFKHWIIPQVGEGVKNNCLLITIYIANSLGQRTDFSTQGKWELFILLEISNNHKYILTGSHICKILIHNWPGQREKAPCLFPYYILYYPFSTNPLLQDKSNFSITLELPTQSYRAQSCHPLWMLSFIQLPPKYLFLFIPTVSWFGLSSLLSRQMHFPANSFPCFRLCPSISPMWCYQQNSL